MNLRRLHRIVGILFAPFFILTAVTGMVLLWRKAGLYEKGTKEIMLGIHNWEAAAPYIGVLLSLGLLWMVGTGAIMLLQMQRRRKRS